MMNLHEEMTALLRAVNRDVRRGAWELLACALALLLFAGYGYSHIIPLLESLTSANLSLLRHGFVLAFGLGIALVIWCGLILTSRHFASEQNSRDSTGN
ncbi:hypothetical protein [Ralstonia sp. ASV6]|uniref:hypothetical protein n=1 Tax=Ralstonia sp. ASV6 TaxID=2795124 RepID=UPI0018ED407D|nr:hypothetical protein [Ralstonia sp. ASV6]